MYKTKNSKYNAGSKAAKAVMAPANKMGNATSAPKKQKSYKGASAGAWTAHTPSVKHVKKVSSVQVGQNTKVSKKYAKKPTYKRKYNVEVYDGRGGGDEFESTSRDSIKHLRDNYGPQGGARCIVRNKKGEVVSAAGYSDEFGYSHILVK